MGYFCIIGIRF